MYFNKTTWRYILEGCHLQTIVDTLLGLRVKAFYEIRHLATCHVHKSRALVRVLSQTSPVHTLYS
jgi:hypothetical protein